MCCPAMRFALSVADVRLLCEERVTDDTEGSHMSVTRRVNAVACVALRGYVEGVVLSHEGGA